MKTMLPFAAVAALAALASIGAPSHEASARTLIQKAPGSVSMDAALERSKLLAGERGETFLRVALVGAPSPKTDRLPMNAVVVIDRSGSMGGRSPTGTEKMRDAREAAKFLVSQLRVGDRVAIVSFDNGAEVISEARRIEPGAIKSINARIDKLYSRGGTDMVAGLRAGIAQAKSVFRRDRVNRIILISDGLPDTEKGLTQLTRKAATAGITVTTMGVGTDYNEDLMSKLADAGQGNYYFINDSSRMAAIFGQELETMAAVVAREAVVKIALAKGVKVEQVYGYEASIGRREAAIPVGDIMGGRYAEVLARLSFPASSGKTELVDVTLAYHDVLANAGRSESRTVAATFVADKKEVVASANKEVAEKVEKVKVAAAVEEAMAEYKAGNIGKAKGIIRRQNTATRAANASIGSAGLAAELSQMTELEDSITGALAPAAQSAVQKKAKMRSRRLKR